MKQAGEGNFARFAFVVVGFDPQRSALVMLRCTAKRCLEARTVAMSSFEARLRRAPQDDDER